MQTFRVCYQAIASRVVNHSCLLKEPATAQVVSKSWSWQLFHRLGNSDAGLPDRNFNCFKSFRFGLFNSSIFLIFFIFFTNAYNCNNEGQNQGTEANEDNNENSLVVLKNDPLNLWVVLNVYACALVDYCRTVVGMTYLDFIIH